MAVRKLPKQARSQQRVDTILDTAAQLFEEVGYESATTNEIALRAGVPIGSLYQFFTNKDAILNALVERYVWPGLDGVPGNAHADADFLGELDGGQEGYVHVGDD